MLTTADAGVAARRLRDGAAAGLMLNGADQVGRLGAVALLDRTTIRELGRMLIGVAVREGAPRPDISSKADLRAARSWPAPCPTMRSRSRPVLGAVTTRVADCAGAAAFLDWLTGADGQARFRAAGFAVG